MGDAVAARKDTDEVLGMMQGFIHNVSEWLDAHDARLDTIATKLKAHDQEFRKLNGLSDRLLNTHTTFSGSVDKRETVMQARDRQFDRLQAWASKVSEKTGVPLEIYYA